MIPILVRIFECSIFYLLQDEHIVQYPWDAMEHKIFQTKNTKKTTYMPMGYLTVGYGYRTYNWDIMEYDWDIVKD